MNFRTLLVSFLIFFLAFSPAHAAHLLKIGQIVPLAKTHTESFPTNFSDPSGLNPIAPALPAPAPLPSLPSLLPYIPAVVDVLVTTGTAGGALAGAGIIGIAGYGILYNPGGVVDATMGPSPSGGLINVTPGTDALGGNIGLILMSEASDAARKRGAELVKGQKDSGVGANVGRSGGHGTPYKRAGNQLIQEANATKDKALADALKAEGKRLLNKGKGIDHACK